MRRCNYGQYYAVYLPNHHMADANGMVYEHRLVAEEILGRPLKNTEFVHHINENKKDNRPENLMVFKTCSDHNAFHSGKDIVLDGDVYVCDRSSENYVDSRHAICPYCGKFMSINAKMCFECRDKEVHSHLPSKNVLIELIKSTPFLTIGKMYGVSDNAVRKWCRYYNLPYRKNDIKEYFK
jgi:hypothetical protein